MKQFPTRCISTAFITATILCTTLMLAGCGGDKSGGSSTTTTANETTAAVGTTVAPLAASTVEAAKAVLAAKPAEAKVVSGADGFLYLPSEVSFLSKGPFWGAEAAKASAAKNSAWADPLPAIVDFNDKLKARGIELIVVPVPTKATIYGHKLGLPAPAATDPLPTFLEVLRGKGVDVLDLTEAMQKAATKAPMHCTTDTHWSPQAIELAAETIYTQLKGKPWAVAKDTYKTETQTIDYGGDLVGLADDPSIPPESFTVNRVLTSEGQVVPEDTSSPVLVIGDSHTLFCHDPQMVTDGAGLSDHLALRFGFPVDLTGIRGSASTAVRQQMLLDQIRSAKNGKDYLGSKKAVIWCFAAREFTESIGGWRQMPIEK